MQAHGGTPLPIAVCRSLLAGVFNLLVASLRQGGARCLLMGLREVPECLLAAAAITTLSNLGFVISLLRVDTAKALLLISLNPLWAALLGYLLLGDELERRTVCAQTLALVAIALVFLPNLMAMSEHASLPSPDELFDLASSPLASALTALLAWLLAEEQGVGSIIDGVSYTFWLYLAVDCLCITSFNFACIIAPRYVPSAQ
ncbi:MAG: hypothetical protein SGPRY_011282, partial [Prymnesium sp.]